MVGLEHSECLIGNTSVVCALSGLNGSGNLAGGAARRLRVFALSVGRALVEGSEDHGRASQQSEELCELHNDRGVGIEGKQILMK